MSRRPVLVILAVAAVLTAGLGAVAIWRVPLAQSLFDWAVADLGIPGARGTVERITGDRLRLVDLVGGMRSELTVDSIEVDFRAPEVLRGRLESVTVDGLTLKLDLRDGAALLGSLQPLADRARESGESAGGGSLPPSLPDVELRQGRIEAETPFGPASLAFDGAFGGAPDGAAGENRDAGPALHLQGQLESAWGSLAADLSASGNPQEDARAHLSLSGGAIQLPDDLLRIRNLTDDLDVGVEDGRPHAGHGEFAADGLTVAGTPFDRARASFELSRERAGLTAALGSDDGSFDLSLDGRAEALDTTPRLTLGMRSEIGEAAPFWAFSRPPFPTGGSGHIELEAVGDFPAPPPLRAETDALTSWLAEGALSGTATGAFSRLSLPDSEVEATALVDLDADWANGELGLTTRQENRVSATGIAARDLAAFDLPAEFADELIRLTGGTLSLAFPAPSQAPAALTWRRDDPAPNARFDGSAVITAGPIAATLIGRAEAALEPPPSLSHADLRDIAISADGIAIAGQTLDEFQVAGSFIGDPQSFETAGEVRGRLAAPGLNGVSADRLSLSLPFQVARDAETFDLALPRPGRLTLDGFKAAGLITAEAPLDVTLAGGEARLTRAGANGAFVLSHTAQIGVAEMRLLLQSDDGEPMPFEIRLPSLALSGDLGEDGRYRGQAAVREAALTLPESELALEGLSVDLTLPGDPERATADFELAVRHLASPAALAPLRVTGRAERRGDTVELTAEARRMDGERLAEVAATHDLASGSGQADVTLLALRFAPGGLQPAALSPLLAELSEVSGAAEGSAAIAWTRGGLTGTAQVVVEDLSFSGNGAAVSGLDLSLELDSLQPLSSPPHQQLSADSVDVGVPLRDLTARFRLPPDAPGQILLEEASFATVGSHVTVRETLIDPTGERLDTQLLVNELDVGVLFDVLAVDGLSGSGELAGTIPIRREGDRVIIENARLEAGGPGVLRFRSDAAAQALAGGGEHVDLVIKALQNFQYQTLTLTGNLDRDGEARLRLEILGNNPDVLDGHPFQLNINLTGNPAPILEVLQLSRTLINNILQRARRLSQ